MLLIFSTCVGVPLVAVRSALLKSATFCESVAVGDPIAGLEDRAQKAGLQVISTTAGTTMPPRLLAWAGFGFLRSFCTLEHDGRKVTSKRLSQLD